MKDVWENNLKFPTMNREENKKEESTSAHSNDGARNPIVSGISQGWWETY